MNPNKAGHFNDLLVACSFVQGYLTEGSALKEFVDEKLTEEEKKTVVDIIGKLVGPIIDGNLSTTSDSLIIPYDPVV